MKSRVSGLQSGECETPCSHMTGWTVNRRKKPILRYTRTKTGMDAIETVSEMLKENPNKPISSFPAYLNKIASGEKPAYRKQSAARQKTGVYSGQLPDWYSDTGSKFASEPERQQMLAEVEKARAQFSLGEKGEK